MAYVPDYDHDVFVSYAHLDDQGESAWVTNLVRHLDTEGRQRLGTKDLRIWIDYSLDGNRPAAQQIIRPQNKICRRAPFSGDSTRHCKKCRQAGPAMARSHRRSGSS